VLYNEHHHDVESIGEIIYKDLIGGSKRKVGADLLLVVGTSLKVLGTKSIVRDFAKSVRHRRASGLQGPSRRSPGAKDESPTTIYLNLEFPVPTREWEGVFDVWLRGDAQMFASMLSEEIAKETAVKDRKRKR
jgi:NAD-dependent histone deacetylase SIR2